MRLSKLEAIVPLCKSGRTCGKPEWTQETHRDSSGMDWFHLSQRWTNTCLQDKVMSLRVLFPLIVSFPLGGCGQSGAGCPLGLLSGFSVEKDGRIWTWKALVQTGRPGGKRQSIPCCECAKLISNNAFSSVSIQCIRELDEILISFGWMRIRFKGTEASRQTKTPTTISKCLMSEPVCLARAYWSFMAGAVGLVSRTISICSWTVSGVGRVTFGC